ncbi:MAG: ABC transporter permease, partial [Lautropia sp.]
RQITLVLMTPVLIASFMLSLIRGIEAFESPLFFGTPAGITVNTTEIYNAINHRAIPDYQYATALSLGVVVFMFLLVLLQWRVLAGRSFATVTGKGYRPHVTSLGRWRWVTFAICVLFFFVTVALPISQLLLSSFFRFFGFYQLNMLTLDNYRAVWANAEFWRALGNTLLLGVVGATATMTLGAVVAYVGVRTRWRWRFVVDALAWLPWMMPGMVLGIGFLWAYAVLPPAIPIYGTLWALLLAYVALGTPIATRVMSASFAQLSFDLEECSRVHGASWWQTLWRILVALSWPAFMVGWILTFFGIMRELSASILLYSVGTETLSVIVLKLWSAGKAEEVSVIGLLMMLLVIGFRLIHLQLVKRRVGAL